MLTIYEELLLLSIDDEKGVTVPSVKEKLAFGLAGAVLAELALQGKLRVDDKGRLELTGQGEVGNQILDEFLKEVQSTEKNRKVNFWVEQLGSRPKKFRERIEERLVSQGVLVEENKHFFKIADTTEAQPDYLNKFAMKGKLRAMILSDQAAEYQSLALLAVVRASEMLSLIFTDDERRSARRMIHKKLIQASLEDPALQVIEEIADAVTNTLENEVN